MEIHTAKSEQVLADIINHRKNGARVGLIFNLANLEPRHRNEEYIKIALNVLVDGLSNCNGDIISFSDGDVFVICDVVDADRLEEAIFQMRYLFVDDPLAYISPGVANTNFCHVFDLQENWERFMERCKNKIVNAQNDNFAQAVPRDMSDLKNLLIAAIEDGLSSINLDDYLNKSHIWMYSDDNSFRPVIKEVYINKERVSGALLEKLPFLANLHLWRFFSDILDVALLIKLLSGAELESDMGHLICLSMHTLNSEEFALFDSAITPEIRKNIIISIDASEVVSDIRAFSMIREALQVRGYKVCLQDMDRDAFMMIATEHLNVDLVKLKYDSYMSDRQSADIVSALQSRVERLKSTHVVLTHCDEKAFDTGRAFGIYLFKGQFSYEDADRSI